MIASWAWGGNDRWRLNPSVMEAHTDRSRHVVLVDNNSVRPSNEWCDGPFLNVKTVTKFYYFFGSRVLHIHTNEVVHIIYLRCIAYAYYTVGMCVQSLYGISSRSMRGADFLILLLTLSLIKTHRPLLCIIYRTLPHSCFYWLCVKSLSSPLTIIIISGTLQLLLLCVARASTKRKTKQIIYFNNISVRCIILRI